MWATKFLASFFFFLKKDLIWTKTLFTTPRMQKPFASGLNLTKVELSSCLRCFCHSTSYPISLSRWSNPSHSIANLYFWKYRLILYFPALNWSIIYSPLKSCMIWFKVSCPLHNHLFLWSSVPRHSFRFIKLGIGLLHLLITYRRSRLDKKTSFLFCWALDPGQVVGFKSLLMRISHSSRPSEELFDFKKITNMCTLKWRISININNRFNFIFSSFWSKKYFLYSVTRHKHFGLFS